MAIQNTATQAQNRWFFIAITPLLYVSLYYTILRGMPPLQTDIFRAFVCGRPFARLPQTPTRLIGAQRNFLDKIRPAHRTKHLLSPRCMPRPPKRRQKRRTAFAVRLSYSGKAVFPAGFDLSRLKTITAYRILGSPNAYIVFFVSFRISCRTRRLRVSGLSTIRSTPSILYGRQR